MRFDLVCERCSRLLAECADRESERGDLRDRVTKAEAAVARVEALAEALRKIWPRVHERRRDVSDMLYRALEDRAVTRHDDAADRIRTAGLARYGPALFEGATEAEAEQHGTTDCPVEMIRANAGPEDARLVCSACGAEVCDNSHWAH